MGGTTVDFSYFFGGLRKTKTSGGVTKNYYYDGDRLIAEKWSTGAYLLYHYDETGSPYAITYSATGGGYAKYYLIKNLQGDVLQIRNVNNAVVANYEYDAWGRVVSVKYANGNDINVSNHIGVINPIRYRGYYYDSETGFYYLKSRYYDPAICRFISADDPSYLGAGETTQGLNLFAYCLNDPVNYSDSDGQWPSWATKLVVAVAVVAVVATVAAVTVATAGAGTAAAAIAVGAAKGAAAGMASGAAIGAATGAVSHRVSTGSWSGADKAALDGMANGALSGAVTGAITGGIKSGMQYGTFSSKKQLLSHYAKHQRDFDGMYANAKEYAKGAKYVVKNGQYIPEKNAYIRFLGLQGKANYAFVGMNRHGRVLTYHIKSVGKMVTENVSLFS